MAEIIPSLSGCPVRIILAFTSRKSRARASKIKECRCLAIIPRKSPCTLYDLAWESSARIFGTGLGNIPAPYVLE